MTQLVNDPTIVALHAQVVAPFYYAMPFLIAIAVIVIGAFPRKKKI
jgi:hypothetical protein